MSDDNDEFRAQLERENALEALAVRMRVGRDLQGLVEGYLASRQTGYTERVREAAERLKPEVERYLNDYGSEPSELTRYCQTLLPELTVLVPATPPSTAPAPSPVPRPAAQAGPSRIVSPNPPAVPPEPVRVLIVPGSYLRLENIVCVDADGNVFEQYPKLDVRTDVFKDGRGKTLSFTSYKATRSAEEQGCFNPSFALHCAIIAALYQRRADPLHAAVLQQYKDKGNGNGGHRPNTLIDWGRQQIIHYPRDEDFPAYGGTVGINTSRNRIIRPFDKAGFQDQLLAEALRRPNDHRYLRNLTGLPDPAVLTEIGDYFERPAKSWISHSNDVRAGWLGADDGNFLLGADDDLGGTGAARGVRLVENFTA